MKIGSKRFFVALELSKRRLGGWEGGNEMKILYIGGEHETLILRDDYIVYDDEEIDRDK